MASMQYWISETFVIASYKGRRTRSQQARSRDQGILTAKCRVTPKIEKVPSWSRCQAVLMLTEEAVNLITRLSRY